MNVDVNRSTPAAAAPAPDEEPAMCFDRATLAYGDRVVWSELSMTVPQGEFLAVLGPNGSGKGIDGGASSASSTSSASPAE